MLSIKFYGAMETDIDVKSYRDTKISSILEE
jgi:hypothetical protein